ncbi:MAG: hypothetical protein HY671_09575 [Chloroflexi bacterium]|nr:hypothetical protein [Chloroflexota bacterium]
MSKPSRLVLPLGLAVALVVAAPGCSDFDALPGAPSDLQTQGFDMFKKSTFKEKADEFNARYTSTLDDLLAYQENADLDKIEAKREELVSEANALVAKLQAAAEGLQVSLDRSTQQAAANQPGAQTRGTDMAFRNALQQKADEFYSQYTAVVDDMLEYEKDGDLQKLERKRQQLISQADALKSKLIELANRLQPRKDNPPTEETTGIKIAGIDPLDRKAAEDKAEEFYTRYAATIDDMLSFQEQPDYRKAEEKGQLLATEANTLASKFRETATRLQATLDRLRRQGFGPGRQQ